MQHIHKCFLTFTNTLVLQLMHQGQLKVQYLVQEYFSTPTGGISDQATDRLALPLEQQSSTATVLMNKSTSGFNQFLQ